MKMIIQCSRERVLERYGTRAESLLNSTRDAYVSALGHQGLLAVRAGDVLTARRYFLRAWRYERLSLRTVLRFARTFLPASLAKTLSGRTRNAQQNAQTDRSYALARQNDPMVSRADRAPPHSVAESCAVW